MHASDALTDWLGDARAQADSTARAARVAARPGHEALRDFAVSVAAAGEDPATLLAATRTLLADPGWAEELVAALAAEAAADPFFLPPFRHLHHDVHDGLLLVDGETVSIGLIALSPDALALRRRRSEGRETIGFSGTLALHRVLRGAARIALWRCPRIDARFDAGTDPRCRAAGTRELAAGDWLLVDGREEAFVIEAMSAPLVLLQAMIVPGRAPLAVDFDAATGAFAAATATDPAASQRQMMATLLRRLGRVEAVPALAREAADETFFVRWHALREWLVLAPETALPRLREMAANDPHRDVRMAAARTLERLDARACPA